MPEGRRGNTNTYCKNLTSVSNIVNKVEASSTVTEMARVFGGRYYKLNLQSYLKYSTVEFRQHSGINIWRYPYGASLANPDFEEIKYHQTPKPV